MAKANTQSLLDAAIEQNNRDAAWKLFVESWHAGQSPGMSSEVFKWLFCVAYISKTAADLVARTPFVQEQLIGPARNLSTDQLDDLDVLRVWATVLGVEELEKLYRARRPALRPPERVSLCERVLSALVSLWGRTAARPMAIGWWRTLDLLEEEREGLIVKLDNHGALNRAVLDQMGGDALRIVQRLVSKGRVDMASVLDDGDGARVPENGASASAVSRLNSLMARCSVKGDVRDALLTPDELARFALPNLDVHQYDLLVRAFRELRHVYPEFSHLSRFPLAPIGMQMLPDNDALCRLSFPLIRILHTRLVLEAPQLRRSVAHPAEHLVPEVMLYLMQHDVGSYFPELRVDPEVDRRARARWVETTAEAFAMLFLEDATGLDLATLERIPEETEPTPDFRARTRKGERIVFETKGGCLWAMHRRQRDEALEQLQKKHGASARTGRGRKRKAWMDAAGRVFACCLYAARQGEERSSLLHVADPPVDVSRLFREGWEEPARRHHFAAVLQAAGLHEEAEALLTGRGEERGRREAQTFTVDQRAEGNQEQRFYGTYTELERLARSLGHPNPTALRGVRVFTGVRGDYWSAALRCTVPTPRSSEESAARESFFETLPRVGMLPGREADAPPRGYYSLLADGAFLAVEIQ